MYIHISTKIRPRHMLVRKKKKKERTDDVKSPARYPNPLPNANTTSLGANNSPNVRTAVDESTPVEMKLYIRHPRNSLAIVIFSLSLKKKCRFNLNQSPFWIFKVIGGLSMNCAMGDFCVVIVSG